MLSWPHLLPRSVHRLVLGLLALILAAPNLPADSLDHWTARASGTTRNLNGVTWGDGLYVCVGAAGAIITSTNGLTWDNIDLAITNELFGITYADGKFVAVGSGGAIMLSTNGRAWMTVPPVITNQLNAVGFGAGSFIAAGKSPDILVSSDGEHWTRINVYAAEFHGVTYGHETFVIVGDQNRNPGVVFSSADGLTWSNRSYLQLGVAFYGVTFGNGLFLALDARSVVYGSTDGITWTQKAFSAGGGTSYLYGAAYGQGYFVAVGGAFSGPSRKIVTSSDGRLWKLRLADGVAPGLRAVCYANGYFIAVGATGTILQSDPVFTLAPLKLSSAGMELELTGEIGRAYLMQAWDPASQSIWQDQQSVTNTAGTILFTDPQATNAPRRLYRALQL